MQKMKSLFAVGAASAALVVSNAHAALPTGVESAISTAGTDAATVGGAVLVVLIGIAAFKYIRKAM